MIKTFFQHAGGHLNVSDVAWKITRLLSVYRLTLAVLFISIFLFLPAYAPLGHQYPQIFFLSVSVYFFYSIASIIAVRLRKPDFYFQVYFNATVDVFFVLTCMYSSGGIESGLGMLMIVFIAGLSVLAPGRLALAYAAASTLLVLLMHSYDVLNHDAEIGGYLPAGLLGVTFFIVVFAASVLAKQLKDSRALAEQRGIDLANMGQLNEYIVQRMTSGLLVLDNKNQIRLLNEAAIAFLGADQIPQELTDQLKHWMTVEDYEPRAFQAKGGHSIYPRFTRLGTKVHVGTLILLDDAAALSQQAQQLKMSALGRLTGSIAHEIRNPLGAISHAEQLLAESENLNKSDRRLVTIIHEQAVRMNGMIENIMQLNRRDKMALEELDLHAWLVSFVSEFSRLKLIDEKQIEIQIAPIGVKIKMDSSHLYQIMFNLCQNGLQHGKHKQAPILLKLHGGEKPETHEPFLDVIDNGAGIDQETARQIFEPFFTTAAKGTGLGLYIARELAEANQVRLDYVRQDEGGYFHLRFRQKRQE